MAHNKLNTLAAALGLALAGQLFPSSEAAAQSGFSLVSLDQGYLLSEHGEHGGEKKGEEGKCGEGKCGEGKCGGETGDKGEEGKCGEGKCGEGKCGSA